MLFVKHKQNLMILKIFVREIQTQFSEFWKIVFVKHKQYFPIFRKMCSWTTNKIPGIWGFLFVKHKQNFPNFRKFVRATQKHFQIQSNNLYILPRIRTHKHNFGQRSWYQDIAKSRTSLIVIFIQSRRVENPGFRHACFQCEIFQPIYILNIWLIVRLKAEIVYFQFVKLLCS